jgi:hypothetical protein
MPESIFMKLGMYIMTTEPISMAYFINVSRPSVCLYVCPSYCSKATVGYVYPAFRCQAAPRKHVSAAKNTHSNRGIVGCVILYAIRVLSKESLWVRLYIPQGMFGNTSVKTLSLQRRIVGGVVFYAVRVISKESRRLVLPRTPCFIMN